MREDVLESFRDLTDAQEKSAKVLLQEYGRVLQLVRDPPKTAEGMLEMYKEVVDYLYVVKESMNVLKESRNELGRITNYLEQLLGKMLQLKQEDDGVMRGATIRTEWTTASPRYSLQVAVPKKDREPELFASMCEYMGIPEHVHKNEAIKIEWKGLQAELQRKLAEGVPLPEGYAVDDLYIRYSVSCTKKRDLLKRDKDEHKQEAV